MKRLFFAVAAAILFSSCVQAQNFDVRTGGAPRSQANLNFLFAGEQQFLNAFKNSQPWSYLTGGAFASPLELDTNGYPIHTATAFSNGGTTTIFSEVPSVAELTIDGNATPTQNVLTWVGAGNLSVSHVGATVTGSSGTCTGTYTTIGGGRIGCSNVACTAMVGSIAGTTLHVTTATTGTGCDPLIAGQPVSDAGTNPFCGSGSTICLTNYGTPTIVTAKIATQGSDVETYTINNSQTVSSETIYPGGRFVVMTATADATATNASYNVGIISSGTDPVPLNTARYIGFYNLSDEPAYESGGRWTNDAGIFGSKFFPRLKDGNFYSLRDLNWEGSSSGENEADCSTWEQRKPVTFYNWDFPEFRQNLFIGNPVSYTANINTFTASVGFAATGTGSGTNLTLSGVSGVVVPASGTGSVLGYAGDAVTGTGVPASTIIVSQTSGTPGSDGVYVTNHSTTSSGASITGKSSILDVTSVSSGVVRPYMDLTGNTGFTGTGTQTYVVAPVNGATTGTGLYALNQYPNLSTFVLQRNVPSESISVVSNDYTATCPSTASCFGSSALTEKESFLVLWNNSPATNTVTISLSGINGGAVIPIISITGYGSLSFQTPVSGKYALLTYDSVFGAFLAAGPSGQGATIGYGDAVDCGAPPEVFLELNAELGTRPWHVAYSLASDPVSDYDAQFYALAKSRKLNPIAEPPDEVWNTAQVPTEYAENKAFLYSLFDPAWVRNDFLNWNGKVISSLGQVVSSVFGGDTTQYDMIAGIQTNFFPASHSNVVLTSTSYLGQNTSNIPIQSGCAGPNPTLCPQPFLQEAAYKVATRVTVTDYWQSAELLTNQEVIDAFNYYYGSSSAQATAMGNFMGNAQSFLNKLKWLWADPSTGQYAWATTCAGNSPCPINGLINYEGGMISTNSGFSATDKTIGVSGVALVNPCVLTPSPFTIASGAVFTSSQGSSYNSSTGLVTLGFSSAVVSGPRMQITVTGAAGTGANISSLNGTFTAGADSGAVSTNTAAVHSANSVLTYTIATGLTITSITGINVYFNGAVAGMPLTLASVGGTTQLNNPVPDTVTFSNGSAVITGTNTLLAGQAVVFSTTASLPTPLNPGTPYYVLASGLSSSQFEVSTTSGGAAVTMTSAGSGTQKAQEAWFVDPSGPTPSAIPITVDCSAFGAYTSGGTLDYYGSATWLNLLRQSSYVSSQAGDLTSQLYSNMATASPGAFPYPSQYTVAENVYAWNAIAFDIYGYFPLASSTLSTISGNTMTLGGTVTGRFQVGQTIFGVSGTQTITAGSIIQSITQVGPGPAGTNAGDTLTLSQSSTVSTPEVITGNFHVNSISPMWSAIRRWNGNGGYLLDGDLHRRIDDPDANDNSPAFLDKAA